MRGGESLISGAFPRIEAELMEVLEAEVTKE